MGGIKCRLDITVGKSLDAHCFQFQIDVAIHVCRVDCVHEIGYVKWNVGGGVVYPFGVVPHDGDFCESRLSLLFCFILVCKVNAMSLHKACFVRFCRSLPVVYDELKGNSISSGESNPSAAPSFRASSSWMRTWHSEKDLVKDIVILLLSLRRLTVSAGFYTEQLVGLIVIQNCVKVTIQNSQDSLGTVRCLLKLNCDKKYEFASKGSKNEINMQGPTGKQHFLPRIQSHFLGSDALS